MELQASFLRVWEEKGGYWLTDASRSHRGERFLDALIMPLAPHPILPIDRWNTVNYTAALNLLDLPSGVLPVRSFDEADMAGTIPDSKALNRWDEINREPWTDVDLKVYSGSPLSIQVITPRLTERRLLDVMHAVSTILEPLKNQSQSYGNSKL